MKSRLTKTFVMFAAAFAFSLSLSSALRADDHVDADGVFCTKGGGCNCCRYLSCPANHINQCPDGHHECKHHPGEHCNSSIMN